MLAGTILKSIALSPSLPETSRLEADNTHKETSDLLAAAQLQKVTILAQ